MKFLKPFLLSIAAGICIGIGGTLNIICNANDLKVLGGLLFSIGLFLICLFGFKLFTGQVGYLFSKENKLAFLGQLGIFYLGNLIGAVGLGYLLRLCFSDEYLSVGEALANHKLIDLGRGVGGQPWYSMIILSFFCGMLVFFAVEIFRREKVHAFLRFAGLVCAISAFVICGFEHCIADMFYFGFAGTWTSTTVLETLVSVLCGSSGNIIGAFAAYGLTKLVDLKV